MGDTVWVNPVEVYHKSEPISVYYERFGLMRDSSYKVELQVRPTGGVTFFKKLLKLFGGSGAPVNITTKGLARATSDAKQQEIGIQKLNPGHYILEVTVSGGSGPKVTRHQEFTVVQ